MCRLCDCVECMLWMVHSGTFYFTSKLPYINKHYTVKTTRVIHYGIALCENPCTMSHPWNIQKGIGDPTKPNGEYNNTGDFNNGVNAKRIRNNLWPSGKFNDKDGPLSALQNSDSSMRSMSKNLSTNQTVMTLYINIPRLVVPIQIPHISEARNIPVAKCIGAGDVVFQLRYNEVMLKSGNATQVINRYMPDLVYCANLATINYILFGIQTLLADMYHSAISLNRTKTQAEFNQLWIGQKEIWKNSRDIVDKARLRWNDFLNTISTGDFSSMISNCFFDGYAELADFRHDTEEVLQNKYMAYVDEFLWDFVNTYAKIGGIFIGSDNQGGAHYGDPNPASYAPSDYVGTLQVAGKNFKVRNMWSACQGGTSSGDILGFKLKFFKTQTTGGQPPLVFRLSSNSVTQCEQTVNISQNVHNLGGYSMLVPSKKKRDTFRTNHVMPCEERSNGFLQFGICDQISKPSNIFNNPLVSACDATASVVPAPFQIYMRLGFTKFPDVNVVSIRNTAFNDAHVGVLPPSPSSPSSTLVTATPGSFTSSPQIPSVPPQIRRRQGTISGAGASVDFATDVDIVPMTNTIDALPESPGSKNTKQNETIQEDVHTHDIDTIPALVPVQKSRRVRKSVTPVVPESDTEPNANAMHVDP